MYSAVAIESPFNSQSGKFPEKGEIREWDRFRKPGESSQKSISSFWAATRENSTSTTLILQTQVFRQIRSSHP